MDPMKILIVDDEREISRSLAEILEEDGYGVVCAQNCIQATSALAEGIDLAIVDVKIGSENGIDLLRRCKEDFPQLPVIMISGQGTVSLRMRNKITFTHLGVNMYILLRESRANKNES